jgi:hypothetical protein
MFIAVTYSAISKRFCSYCRRAAFLLASFQYDPLIYCSSFLCIWKVVIFIEIEQGCARSDCIICSIAILLSHSLYKKRLCGGCNLYNRYRVCCTILDSVSNQPTHCTTKTHRYMQSIGFTIVLYLELNNLLLSFQLRAISHLWRWQQQKVPTRKSMGCRWL